jgi:hypothetical protein
MQATLATWEARHLPAFLDVVATAELPGFAKHVIQVLVAADKLTPFGGPFHQRADMVCRR